MQKFSYKFCFLITAIIYTFATGIFSLLLAADVPQEKAKTVTRSENEREDALLRPGYGEYHQIDSNERNGSGENVKRSGLIN